MDYRPVIGAIRWTLPTPGLSREDLLPTQCCYELRSRALCAQAIFHRFDYFILIATVLVVGGTILVSKVVFVPWLNNIIWTAILVILIAALVYGQMFLSRLCSCN